jgi:hypothetical protein
MATKPKTIVKRIIVALNFPSSIADFLVYVKAIYKAMLNNAYFTSSAAKLTTLGTDITAFDTAEIACKTKPPTGTVDARNAAMELVMSDVRSLRADVQAAADANPAKAEAIITSSAMGIKKTTTHEKRKNSVKNSEEDGCVDVEAEGSGPHEFRMSTDDKTLTALPASRTAKTKVPNLTSGVLYYFQNRRMLTNGEKSEWSQSVKIRVK